MTSQHEVTGRWRRHSLGVAGVLFSVIGIYFWIWPAQNASLEFLHGSAIKSGLVLCAAWLAFPQLDRMPSWMFAVTVAALLSVAMIPRFTAVLIRYALYLLPLLVLIWILRPKTRRHGRHTRRSVDQ